MKPGTPRHVLMTADAVGGVWTYALNLAAALAPAGVQITLAVLGPEPSKEQRREAKRLANLDLVCFNGKLEWMERPWTDVDRRSEQLLKLEAKLRPQLVHLNDYSSGSLEFKAPVVLVGHSCVCSWWESVKGATAPRRYNEYRRRVADGLACVDAVVAPSESMLKSLKRLYGPLPSPRVINNGLSPVVQEGAADEHVAKEQVILAAGRVWDDAKNLRLVLQEAALFPWPVRVAGEWPPEISAPSKVAALGRLSLAGMAREMMKASIFVHPARYEPFGLAPLEAALHGCALVLGDIPSLREIWGDAAQYVHPMDGQALRNTVTSLCNDARRLAQWARRAERRAQRYSLVRFGAAYFDLYRTLCAEALPLNAAAIPLARKG